MTGLLPLRVLSAVGTDSDCTQWVDLGLGTSKYRYFHFLPIPSILNSDPYRIGFAFFCIVSGRMLGATELSKA
jgi:hypothetical protein